MAGDVDEKQKTVLLSEQGYEDAEEILGVKDLYDPREQWASYILNAIKAKELFLRDVNYIVRGKEVFIVDEFTGRVMQGRRWSDGLHQAVEAKEGLPIQNETVTLASISYQNFFLQFPKLCGMTGTAATESTEFESIYKLKVTIVPTNKPMIRKDESDVVFRATSGKWRAVVVEISRMHKTGRPVLVGTTSVEQSDSLSELLKEAEIPHEVLNAKPENVEREAEIVAQSGRLGAVTIATNMAGRGTDIILGGNAEFMARLKLREILMSRYSFIMENIEYYLKRYLKGKGIGLVGKVRILKGRCCLGWAFRDKRKEKKNLSEVKGVRCLYYVVRGFQAPPTAYCSMCIRWLHNLTVFWDLFTTLIGKHSDYSYTVVKFLFLEPVLVVKPSEEGFVSIKKPPPYKTWKQLGRRKDEFYNSMQYAKKRMACLNQAFSRSSLTVKEVNEKLFPCQLSDKNVNLTEKVVQLAVETWGKRSLTELEAEERLSYACEKGPAQDEVIAKLRNAFLEIGKEYKFFTEEERKKVVEAGGLHVVGTERHESRRIDNQVFFFLPPFPCWVERREAGMELVLDFVIRIPLTCFFHLGAILANPTLSNKQGDPGSSRFFLSLEDNIFRIFGGDRIQGLMRAFRVEDLPIESKMLTKALDEAQRKVENYFFDIRKQLFEYDEVLNSQRDRVYTERRRALESDNLQSLLIEYAELTMDDILEANIGSDAPKDSWDLEKLIAKIQQYCYMLNDLTPDLLKNKCSDYEELRNYLRLRGREAYKQKRETVEEQAAGLMKEAERFLILSNIDRLWKEHLQALKFVQQAVGLRGYAQRDPLIEYKLEGYNLFLDMMAQIRRNVIYSVYQFQPVLVKQDQEKSENGKSGKRKARSRVNPNPDPVGTIEPSTSSTA
ncbi:hypothetical protein V8G54_028679 [Vigna mungo]|uniref:chloroplast protein-transporting ATPase n=1 Tax=Vigna mungo TaxID=3915 RepID=A0AAQ3RIE1_VIGMU